MKTICHALFALSALLIASCSKQTSDIIEWSTNGVTGVRMPLHVTFVENVQVEESAMQDAISITPAVGFDAYLSGMRMIRIVPKSPLQYDTQYKVAIDAAKLTARQHKGIAEFRFATPKLRFTYNDNWLQQNDEMTGYVLIGEIVSSDYAEGSYMERNLKISGTAGTDVKWTHSEDGLTHQYTVGNIVPRGDEGYTLTLDFNYDEKQTLRVEVPRKDEYAVIDHSVNPEPLAIVVTFSEPIRQNQDLKNLIRFDTKFRTLVDKNRLYIYPEARPTGAHSVTIGRDVVSKNGQKLKESYSFTATLPSRTPSIRFTGKGSILPSSNDMSLLFEAVNYQKARVRVRKIFANNLLQFFQQNYYDDQYYSSMDYVSRVVRDTTIDLGARSSTRLDQGNTYSLDELHEFIGRIEKELGQTEFVCELKFDGTAISLTYEHGALLRAVTRGDGTRGDDVTANIRTIRTIPLHLQGGDYPDFFEIRGEVLMPYASTASTANARRTANRCWPIRAMPQRARSSSNPRP